MQSMQSIHAAQNRQMILRFLTKQKKHDQKEDVRFMQVCIKCKVSCSNGPYFCKPLSQRKRDLAIQAPYESQPPIAEYGLFHRALLQKRPSHASTL